MCKCFKQHECIHVFVCVCPVWQCAVMCKWRLFCLLFAHLPCFACVSASLLVVCDLVFVHSFFFCNAAVYVSQSINQSISVWIGRAIGIFFLPPVPPAFLPVLFLLHFFFVSYHWSVLPTQRRPLQLTLLLKFLISFIVIKHYCCL